MFGILPYRARSAGLPTVRSGASAAQRRVPDPESGVSSPRVTGGAMSTLLLLTSTTQPSAEVLPALTLLPHQVRILPAEGSALLEAPDVDLVLVDGRKELAQARDLCRLIRTTGTDSPVVLVVTEGGLSVVAADWAMDDVVLCTCGPAELEARLRLSVGRLAAQRDAADPESRGIRAA